MLKNIKKFLADILKKRGLKISPVRISFLLILVAVALLLFNFRSLFLAALVNGQPISRYSLDRILEKQAGKQTLENLITEALIAQEAKKQKITVSQADVQAKIVQIEQQVEKQGRKLDELLAAQGQTRKNLEEQLRSQVLVEKILGKDIVISDDEVKKFFEDNKTQFPKDTKLENENNKIKEELFQRKLGEKFQPWIGDLKQKAKIYYLLNL